MRAAQGPHDRIVLSSRVRLARNIKEGVFPGRAKKPERVRVMELIQPAVESLPEMNGAFSEAMDRLSPPDKNILVERHLISREHAAKGARQRGGAQPGGNALRHDQRGGSPAHAGVATRIAIAPGVGRD